MKQGISTGQFGEQLTRHIRSKSNLSKYAIYYDHGDACRNDNVVACKGFIGEDVNNLNRLADIDIILTEKNKVKIIIEVEERDSSPKKIIGDIFSIAMCNNIAVKQKEKPNVFKITDKTILIVSGIVPTKGRRKEKIDNVISKNIRKFQRSEEGLNLKNTYLVFEEKIELVLDKVKILIFKVIK